MIWLLTRTVNQMPEFRTALTNEGLGIYDDMHPTYTIFNKGKKNLSGIWTAFNPDFNVFLQAYQSNTKKYSSSVKYSPKPGQPSNSFDISMVPWLSFTSFNINVYGDGKYLLPIFTLGKYFEENGKRLLPLSIQVHHAVCDGYHVGVFVETLQTLINQFSVFSSPSVESLH